MPKDTKAILLFDGVCHLCEKSVQFVLQRDRQAKVHFAALQSEAGQQLLAQHQLAQSDFKSLVLVENGQAYLGSTAALRLLCLLPFPWPIFGVLLWLPRFLRDPVYYWISKNRYRWFGQKEHCMLPKADWQDRFLS